MALYEEILSTITGEDGEKTIESHWVRWSSESPGARGVVLPDDATELNLVKAVAQHCGVRKVRRDAEGLISPVIENVSDYHPPVPMEPMSDGTLAILIGGCVVAGLGLLAAWLASDNDDDTTSAAQNEARAKDAQRRLDDLNEGYKRTVASDEANAVYHKAVGDHAKVPA